MKKITAIVFILLLSYSGHAQRFSWSGVSPILNNQTDTIPIVVSGLPSVIDSLFGIAHICLDITHSNKSNLLITLVSPSGYSVVLIQNIGTSGANFLGTCLGMDGTHFSNAQAPYQGIFVPSGDISTFNNGQDPNGTWLFLVSDQVYADTGSVYNVSLAFVNNPPGSTLANNVPGPPTGVAICASCVCPGGVTDCDLLPDMRSSAKEINLNHTETPGFLDISNATPNTGYGPLEIYGIDSCFCDSTYVPCGTICPSGHDIKHAVKQRVYHKLAGRDTLAFYDRFAGFMTYHATHGHIHVDHWADYTLRTPTANPDARTWPIIGTAVKQSFCLINLGSCSSNSGECLDNNGNPVLTVPNNNVGFNSGCGYNQGIYPGQYDVYSAGLNDPIPLNNVCNGTYYIVSITDPENFFLESDETNNWVAVPITLTQQNVAPTITASGSTTICQGDSVTLNANIASNYLWSTGATTQSIVVSTSGTYTVSTTCGSSSATSTPVAVTVVQLNITASANPSSSNCSGDTVHLTSSAPSGGIQNIPVTFTSNVQVFIPDNNATGVTSTIAVSGINPATLTTTSIVSVSLTLTHTYDGDLAISLIAPSGNTIFLSNREGGSGDNFTNTVFTMSAATLISAGVAPFTGNYKPDGLFSALTGNANGNWILKVQDLAAVDTGRIRSWSITINNAVTETFNYSWTSLPIGFTSTLQNPVVNPSASTVYKVVITSNANNCPGTATVPVIVPPLISLINFSPSAGSPGSVITINGNNLNTVTAVTIAGIPASSFTIMNPNQIQATVPNSVTVTGLICLKNSNNCSYCSNTNYTITSSVILTLKLFIEGFYLGGGLMRAVVDPISYPTLFDTITVELHDTISPYNLAFSQTGTLNTSGEGAFVFPILANRSYYLAVKHRNTIETWSKNPVHFETGSATYDFTTSLSKAYDDGVNPPMKNKSGVFAFYSGDVNRDYTVDILDMSMVDNDATVFAFGYNLSDVTGDGSTDILDMVIIDNNSRLFLYYARP